LALGLLTNRTIRSTLYSPQTQKGGQQMAHGDLAEEIVISNVEYEDDPRVVLRLSYEEWKDRPVHELVARIEKFLATTSGEMIYHTITFE
jgi:hypothetical protein